MSTALPVRYHSRVPKGDLDESNPASMVYRSCDATSAKQVVYRRGHRCEYGVHSVELGGARPNTASSNLTGNALAYSPRQGLLLVERLVKR